MIRSSLSALVLASLLAAGPGLASAQAPPAPSEAAQPPVSAPVPADQSPSGPAGPTEPSASAAAPPTEPAPLASEPSTAAPSPPPAATPAPVQVQDLSQLDLFSTGRETGLGDDVWKGSSAEIARAIIPTLATRPLSPAAMSLARRLLAQVSTGPIGAGRDLDLAVARAKALLALGDAEDASLVLDRTPGLADHAELSRLGAEAALISDQGDKACRIADNLNDGRDGAYWLRLRAFCQARAGKPDAAQLTFDLAATGPKDPALTRLLGVYIAGVGDPGPPSLASGLDFAVSSALKLDVASAMSSAAPAISRHWALMNAPKPEQPVGEDLVQAALARVTDAGGQFAAVGLSGTGPQILADLIDRASNQQAPRLRSQLQAAAALLASLGENVTGASRAHLAEFDLGRSLSPAARLMALDTAASAGLKGEAALLALRIAEEGGASGPPLADRCWIIRALERVGLKTDAVAFAAEGLQALKEL